MKRPDGSGQITGGAWLLCAGLILFLLSFTVNTSTYSGVDVDALFYRWSLLSIAGGLIGMAFILFICGWIIRAISLLPGRDDAVSTTSLAAGELTSQSASEPVSEVEENERNVFWDSIKILALILIVFMMVVFAIDRYDIASTKPADAYNTSEAESALQNDLKTANQLSPEN